MKSKVPTKEELLKHMMESTENWVSNKVWSMHRMEDGIILGSCNEENCCWLEYENFEEMYENGNYDKDKWRLIE